MTLHVQDYSAMQETEMLDCSNLIPGSFGLSSEM